jgi:hypothetical protein
VLRSQIQIENRKEVERAQKRKDAEHKKKAEALYRKFEIEKAEIIHKYEAESDVDAERFRAKYEAMVTKKDNEIKDLERQLDEAEDVITKFQATHVENVCKLASNEKQREKLDTIVKEVLHFAATLESKINTVSQEIQIDRSSTDKNAENMKKTMGL